MKNELFKKLPKVDKLLNSPELKELSKEIDYYTFSKTIKNGIEFFRKEIESGGITDFTENDVINKILDMIETSRMNSLRKLINATGTIIHTNLGRSILPERVTKNICEIASNYSNLEYDLEKGERGSRYFHLESLICKLTGAEGALVVNNNAAAVILALNEFASSGETIVSRGELVEIGGSFRIPDIMKLSGAKLVEIGTTNRTHKRDYENAINENTSLLLKVHASNYKMSGFTSSVSVEELAEVGKKHGVLTMEDIGSGVLIDFSKYGVTKENTIQQSIEAGIDIVMFSGDKLLGGPQAGIIVGKKELIKRLSKNQYLRAFRMGKLAIAALETTLKYYLDEREAVKELPILRMITENPKEVEKRAERISKALTEAGIENEVVETKAKIGGGAMPEETVNSYGVAFSGNANLLEEKFRKNLLPIIGRIHENKFVLDMKTVLENDIEPVFEEVLKIIGDKNA